MSIKYNAYILARKSVNKKMVTLNQRFYYNGVQWQVPLNISVPVELYDNDKELVKGGVDADKYNHVITESKAVLKDIMLRAELVDVDMPSPEDVKRKYLNAMRQRRLIKGVPDDMTPAYRLTIEARIEEFISWGKKCKGWTDGTSKKFRTLKHNLEAYQKAKEPLYYNNLQQAQMYAFFDWGCLQYDWLNTTLTKKIQLVKWYLRWCVRQSYYEGKVHDTLESRYKGGDTESRKIIYLEAEELAKLEQHVFRPDQAELALVRDMFVFSCYCGLRFSDVQKLRPYQIHNGVIEVVMTKTKGHITINLNKHTREIYERYREHGELTGFVFPRISNQKANENVHEMCEICGISEPTLQVYYKGDKCLEVWLPKHELITFHASRRTFITHALRLGIPSEVIIKFSGHKKLSMLKPYMEVVNELKKKEMAKFDQM